MILDPPFTKFEFSLDRSFEFYTGDTNVMDFSYFLDDYFIGKLFNTINHANVVVVGCYSKEYPFFVSKNNVETVYTLDPNFNINVLAPVANSLQSLYKVCDEIRIFIEAEDPNIPLVKDIETVRRMKQIVKDFESYSPNCYAQFWMERPMGELMIGLEL